MSELTLEALAKRLEAVELKLAERYAELPNRYNDWRSTVGMFDDDPEFMRRVDAEVLAIREAERQAAREGRFE
jgi:hypothetical protein